MKVQILRLWEHLPAKVFNLIKRVYVARKDSRLLGEKEKRGNANLMDKIDAFANYCQGFIEEFSRKISK